jgi:hypothetical protein
MPTYLGIYVRLNSLEELQSQFAATEARLDALAPGAREEIRAANIAALPKREKDVWDKPVEKRSSEEQYVFVTVLSPKVKPTNDDIAARVPREKLAVARDIADQLLRLTKEIDMTSRYRGTVNFDYWRARCDAEQTEEALTAREQVHKAEELLSANASLNESRENFEKAWDNWEVVYKKHPLLFDSGEAEELVDNVEHYADLLGRIDVKFPADFKLKVLLEMTDKGQRLRKRLDAVQATATEFTPAKPGEKKPEPAEKPGEKPGEKPPETKEPPAKTDKPAEKTKTDEKPAPAGKEPAKAEGGKKPAADAPAAPPK